MYKLTFITLAYPGSAAQAALMMANSIRTFGGNLGECPIWVLVPADRDTFPSTTMEDFASLKVRVVPFVISPNFNNFPFTAKIAAAAYAEGRAGETTELLTWLDGDNIILREPDEFILNAGKSLGYRPVHHKLIGPAWNEPLDSFWKLVYQFCDVPVDVQFPMVTHTGQKIRPYFNAGTFIIRPELKLMTEWLDTFASLYWRTEFQAYYQKDQVYAIFMHQVILTGVFLRALKPDEMQELTPKINYPLHLHADIPEDLRPESINELTTLRYEDIFNKPEWREDLPIREPLLSWLEKQPVVQKP